MKLFKHILWIGGVTLIVSFCILKADLFNEQRLLYLDGGVLICVYTLFVYVFGTLYDSNRVFERGATAVGVHIHFLRIYAYLALIGVITGLVWSLKFSWQCFYQISFFFFMMAGLLFGRASKERLQQVAEKSGELSRSKKDLESEANQLLTVAYSETLIDSTLKTSIGNLAKRIGYITPSKSKTAKDLEDSLWVSIKLLQDLLNSGASTETLFAELEKAETLLSQRLKVY